MKFLVLSTFLISFSFAKGVSAETLSWEACVERAKKENPALVAATQSYVASQETTRSTQSGYLPQLSASGSFTRSSSALTPASPAFISDNYSTSLNLSQNIFNGLSDSARISQSQANEGIAFANAQSIKAQVSYNLKSAFEGLQYAQQSLVLSQVITGRREQNLRLVELRFKDGRENRGSVLLYQAYFKDAKYSELQSKDAILVAQSQLAQALGMDIFEFLSVSGTIPIQDPSEVNLNQIVPETPGYLQAYYQERSADAGVTLAKSGFFPTLGLSGLLGRAGPDWFPQSQRWSIALNLTLPIFNGGRDFFATRAALDTEKSATATLHDTLHSTLSQLQQSRMAFIEAVERVNVDSGYLEAAKVRAEIARANYKNGLTSFQDWDLAETDLITREKNILVTQRNRVVAEAAWEQAQGKGVIP